MPSENFQESVSFYNIFNNYDELPLAQKLNADAKKVKNLFLQGCIGYLQSVEIYRTMEIPIYLDKEFRDKIQSIKNNIDKPLFIAFGGLEHLIGTSSFLGENNYNPSLVKSLAQLVIIEIYSNINDSGLNPAVIKSYIEQIAATPEGQFPTKLVTNEL